MVYQLRAPPHINTAHSPCLRRLARTPLHARSAVDADHLAVDPLAVLRDQEADDTGDVDGETDAVQRGPASGVLVASC